MSVTVKPRAISFIIQFLFTLFYVVQVAFSAETRTFDYYQVTNPNLGLSSIIGISEKTTHLLCASLCSSQPQCRSFLWDSFDRSCTTGSWPKASGDMILSGSKKLFTQSSKCRFDLGFEFRPYGTKEKCMYISNEKATAFESRERCLEHGGRLYKSNSKELIRLLTAMAKENGVNHAFWVGLNDTDTEDRFIWSDGQTMTTTERSQLFGPGQPDDGKGGQDCVQLMVEYMDKHNFIYDEKFIDISCSTMKHYACEIVI